MSNDDFSLHSYDPNAIDEVDQFYKELSLCFYGQKHKKKISLLMSCSTESASKPSNETLPEIGFVTVKQCPRSGSAKNTNSSRSPTNSRPVKILKKPSVKISSSNSPKHAQKLIKLLQSPSNVKAKQNQKQAYIKKQLEIITRLQLKELKGHYYK